MRKLRISRYGFYKPKPATFSKSEILLVECTNESRLNTLENLPQLESTQLKKQPDETREVINPLYDIRKPLTRNKS